MRTEPIDIIDKNGLREPDGAGGFIVSPVTLATVLAKWQLSKGPQRVEEGKQTTLRQSYQFTFYLDPSLSIVAGTVVRFRSQELTIQSLQPLDVYRRQWVMTAMETSFVS